MVSAHRPPAPEVPPGPATPRVRTLVLEATDPPPGLDLAGAEEWRVVVTVEGTPVAHVRLPSPGRTSGDTLVHAALVRHADAARLRAGLVEGLARRVGGGGAAPRRPTCTAAVCTHRRPQYIGDVLGALGRLDPAPDEILVVDNDPGEADCRAAVEAAGARYVREDRRGLNNARNAAVAAASGELIAFTDDDCVPATTWLRDLPRLFDDPAVAAVTGPAFPYVLDTPAQVAFEAQSSFVRGLHRRVADWTSMAPAHAGSLGAGANMVYRRGVLQTLGRPFAPELDAGTATQSGGDTHTLYRILDAGHRVVYDPAVHVFHQHRPDPGALHKAIVGYGVGLSAVMTKLAVEERNPAALVGWWWLATQYVRTLGLRLAGRAGAVEMRVAWNYVEGGLRGPRAWAAALAKEEAQEGGSLHSGPAAPREDWPPPAAAGPRPFVTAAPAVSVVVATAGRPEAVARCLAALGAQHEVEGGFETLVVDDTPGAAPGDGGLPPGVRRVVTAGQGAARARNAGAEAARGEILLFLDDDLVPAADLVARHLKRHRSGAGERMVVGYSPPRPREPTLAARGAALWWEDHFRRKRDAAAMTFVEILSGNMSVPRGAFRRLQGFDPGFGVYRREDWDWGIRALGDGLRMEFAAEAVAEHEYRLDAPGRIEAARREGHGDALLLRSYPFVAPSLPGRRGRRALLRWPVQGGLFLLLQRPASRRAAAAVLRRLEAAGARGLWLRLFDLAQQGAYEQGVVEGGRGRGTRPGEAPTLEVELTADAVLPPPAVAAPILDVRLDGREAATVRPREGHWNPGLAEQAADSLDAATWPRLAAARELAADRPRPALDDVTVLADGSPAAAPAELAAALEEGAHAAIAALPGGRLDAAAVDELATALEGDRVGVAVAGARGGERAPDPLILHSRLTLSAPFALPLAGPQAVGVSAAAWRALGGFDPRAERLGPHAAVLELIDRALAAGWTVAAAGLPGPPASPRPALEARVALLSARARAMAPGEGVRYLATWGLVPLLAGVARSLRGAGGPREAVGGIAAFAAGLAAGRAPR